MVSTKTLYASTLVLASVAGFSTGWSVRPAEVRVVVSEEERMMAGYEEAYRLTPEDRAALRALLRDYVRDLESLGQEFGRRFQEPVDAVKDRHDARIRALLTDDKRR